ncbi:MAG: AMP-binding protein [Bacteroidales bacterium]|nr:AMP-binding protein [Bacteroidales bacterium]
MSKLTLEAIEFIANWHDSSSEVACFTSGSTGIPSRILLPKEEMKKSARRTIDYFGLNRESNIHSAISLSTIGGRMAWLRAEISGGSFSCEIPSNRPLTDPETTPSHISLLSVVPSQMISILDRLETDRMSLPKIEAILIGGSPIPIGLEERIAASGLNAYETYGMTETASHIAIRKIGNQGTDKKGAFTPLEDIRVFEKDECLGIDIPGWKQIITTDEARVFPDGSFSILGRRDNVIITGGKKVHPEEVEKKLAARIDREVMVKGIPDPKWGSCVKLIISEEGAGARPSLEEAEQICRELLEDYQVPKCIEFGKLPKTTSGKLKRN